MLLIKPTTTSAPPIEAPIEDATFSKSRPMATIRPTLRSALMNSLLSIGKAVPVALNSSSLNQVMQAPASIFLWFLTRIKAKFTGPLTLTAVRAARHFLNIKRITRPMKHFPKLIFIVVLLFSAGPPALAQIGQLHSVTLNYVEASATQTGAVQVQAYVSVLDEQGRPLTNLEAEDFAIFQDGRPVEIESVTIATDPIAVILALDTSGSMATKGANGQIALESAKQAAVSFLEELTDGDKAAAYSFNDEVLPLHDLTHDHNAVINKINELTYKDFGGTCLYDAAIEAIQKSAEVLQGRRAIIVLTDGVDEASQKEGPCSLYTLNDVVAEATQRPSKVPVFAIGFGKAEERELLRMPRLPGGDGLTAESPEDLARLFETISRQLKNQYLVTYQTTAPSGEHTVAVKVTTNDATKTDERPVFTPPLLTGSGSTGDTPSLVVTIVDAIKDQPQVGFLQIVTEINPPDQTEIVQAELFIDGQSAMVLREPPFNEFPLNLENIVGGTHTIRVEVTTANGSIATNQREITIELPAPAPTLVPTPVPTPEPAIMAYLPISMDDPVLLALVAGGFLIGLIIIGLLVFMMTGRRKAKPVMVRSGIDYQSPPMDSFMTRDEGAAASAVDDEKFRTIDVAIYVDAKLHVVESKDLPPSHIFRLSQTKVTIGRDAGTVHNDVNIPDPSVSRHHARITFDGYKFKIFSGNARNGVFVNEDKVEEQGAELPDGAVIRLGASTLLRFEKGNSGFDDPYSTKDFATSYLNGADETMTNTLPSNMGG